MPARDWPCVTAIVNTHLRPKLLDRALLSVLNQTYTDYELIVIHDGPADDETVSVCRDYAEQFDEIKIRFRFIATDEASGYQCVPKNVATWHAKGDYIAYLDDDNEWTDDHLEVLVAAIEEGTVWPDFTYGRRTYIIDEGYEPTQALFEGDSSLVEFNEEGVKRLAEGPQANFIDTSDALIAKGAMWRLQLATEQMWNESYRRFADWELFCRGVHFAGWRGKAVDKIVQRYHWHGKNVQLTRAARETPKEVRA